MEDEKVVERADGQALIESFFALLSSI